MVAKPQLIGILAHNESISADDLDRAVRLQAERDIPLAEVLVGEALLREDDIFFMLQQGLGMAAIPEERLLHLTLPPEIRRRVPRSFARAQVLIPFDLDVHKGLLLVAMFDPSDERALEKLRATARVADIRCYLARRSSILSALKSVYSEEDDFREGEPEWLPAGTTAGEGQAPAAVEGKVEIDPGMVEELEVHSGTRAAEPLRPLRSPGALVFRAAEVAPGGAARPTAAPAPQRRSRPPSAPDPGPGERRVVGVTMLEMIPPPPAPVLAGDPRRPFEEAATGVYEIEADAREDTTEVEMPAQLAFQPENEDLGHELGALLRGATLEGAALAMSASADILLRELLASAGVLISMLEERVDPAAGSCREYGRITRAVARELDLDELGVARLALAAQLFAMDLALRRELGVGARIDVTAAFAAQPSAPGGLGPTLRSLGARALDLEAGAVERPFGVALIGMVADYLELRAESEEDVPDPETIAQLLRAGGADPRMIDSLVRALSFLEEGVRTRVGPAGSG